MMYVFIFNTLHFITVKLLVLNGFPTENGIHLEVIDIHNEDLTCADMSNAPYEMDEGTGGLIENYENYILVCGGWEPNEGDSNKCWYAYINPPSLNVGQKQALTMEYKRNFASSIIINSIDRHNDMVSK